MVHRCIALLLLGLTVGLLAAQPPDFPPLKDPFKKDLPDPFNKPPSPLAGTVWQGSYGDPPVPFTIHFWADGYIEYIPWNSRIDRSIRFDIRGGHLEWGFNGGASFRAPLEVQLAAGPYPGKELTGTGRTSRGNDLPWGVTRVEWRDKDPDSGPESVAETVFGGMAPNHTQLSLRFNKDGTGTYTYPHPEDLAMGADLTWTQTGGTVNVEVKDKQITLHGQRVGDYVEFTRALAGKPDEGWKVKMKLLFKRPKS